MDDLTSPAVLTARCPDDLLAMVPVVLGFEPSESLVMLTFGGRQFHARLDLPRGPGEVREAAAALLAPVRRAAVEAVALVLYAADDRAARRVCKALRRELRQVDVAVVEALRVDDGRWFPLLGEPAVGGVPFDVSAHPFLAEAIVRGRVVHGSRDALAATLEPDAAATAEVERVPAQPPASSEWVAACTRRHVEARTRPGAAEAARLLTAIADQDCRDAAWWGMRRESSRQEVELWTDLVRRCPAPVVADAAAVLAFACWLSGDGALAWCAIDRACEHTPDHSLAGLVGDLLASATPPDEWEVVRSAMRARRSA